MLGEHVGQLIRSDPNALIRDGDARLPISPNHPDPHW
jgi:hypothetical protein